MFSFGEELKRERERRGIDVGQIADATNIARRFLEAIESGRVDAIPGRFYQRAYLRAYARQLGLDPERLLASYELAVTQEEDAHASRAGSPDGSTRAVAAALKWVAIGTVGLGLTGAAAAVWQRSPESAPPPAQSGIGPRDSAASQELLVEGAPLPFVADELAVEPDTAPLVRLSLKVNEPCWLEVVTDGERAVEGIMLRGFEREFRAEEVCFSLGNAGGVSYWVDDRVGKPLGESGQVLKNVCVRPDNVSEFSDDRHDGVSGR